MPSIYIKNKQNWVPIIWGLGALLNFEGNYILIQIFGFYGAPKPAERSNASPYQNHTKFLHQIGHTKSLSTCTKPTPDLHQNHGYQLARNRDLV